jgi:antimicrobial peptide system SdpB family protein
MLAMTSPRSGMIRAGVPWTNCFGAGRSLIALASLLTLLCTNSSALFFPMSVGPASGRCTGAGKLLLFCLGGGYDYLEVKRWSAIAVLIVVVSGWRPRTTCLPHAYVALSFFYGISTPEGGDQIAWIIAVLLIPLCLTDRRPWHWQFFEFQPDSPATPVTQISRCLAIIAVGLIKLQVSWLYLQAGLSKFGGQAWVSGAGMYYWVRNKDFGVAHWLQPVAYWLTSQPIVVAAMTWIPLGIEVALGISLLLPLRARIPLLCAGVGLHFLIGVMTGLWSFSIVMWGCLVFLLSPAGFSFQLERKEAQHTCN